MPETPVLVVVEIISVQDTVGLGAYAERASALIGTYGGTIIGQGVSPVIGEPGFGPLVIQRWTSEAAFHAWLASEAYQPLHAIRVASAKMRVAIVQITAGPDAA